MRSSVALAAVLLSLAALVYFLFGSATPKSARPAEAAASAPAAGGPSAAGEAGGFPSRTQPQPAGRAERTATEVAWPRAPDGLEDGGEQHGPAIDPALRFAARYDGLASEELAVELGRLEREVEAAAARELRALFEAGRFTEIPVEEGETRSLEALAKSAQREGELCESRFVYESAEPPSPAMRPRFVRVACLARSEFPAVYALVDERDWLRHKVAGER